MNQSAQAILPLPGFRPSSGLRPLPARPGGASLRAAGPGTVEYIELPVGEALHRPRRTFAGAAAPAVVAGAWTLNPYRGCEIGCAHCPVRYTHGFLDLDRGGDFARRIFVKREAPAALERQLRRSAVGGRPIVLGTAADPYQPAEERFGVTRGLLEVLLATEGLTLVLRTRSPLVVRDAELLARLDRRHAIRVEMKLPTADAALALRLEPGAAAPAERLAAIARLAAEGLAVTLVCAPLAPGINDGAARLGRLLAAAREAGAVDAVAQPLALPPATGERFWPWLAEEMPRLVPLYRRLYGHRRELRRVDRNRLLAPFRRLRLEHGFPRPLPGRG